MDKLSDLPPKNDTIKTAEEEAVMNQFFAGEPQMTAQPGIVAQRSSTGDPKLTSKLNWKLIGAATLLFVALANPWIDALFCKIPYCGGSSVSVLGLKALLFVMILVVICLFM